MVAIMAGIMTHGMDMADMADMVAIMADTILTTGVPTGQVIIMDTTMDTMDMAGQLLIPTEEWITGTITDIRGLRMRSMVAQKDLRTLIPSTGTAIVHPIPHQESAAHLRR